MGETQRTVTLRASRSSSTAVSPKWSPAPSVATTRDAPPPPPAALEPAAAAAGAAAAAAAAGGFVGVGFATTPARWREAANEAAAAAVAAAAGAAAPSSRSQLSLPSETM